VMWAVNSPHRARKPMTSTAPAVVLRTVGSNQWLRRHASRKPAPRVPRGADHRPANIIFSTQREHEHFFES
jgi:hypothetical protein